MASLGDPPQDARGSLGTVRNAALLLDLLARGPAHQQLTDLAERSGLSVATVHRLLRSLVLAGIVEQDPRTARYGLGPEVVRLSHRYLARLPVLGALSPYLVQLRDHLQATVRVQLLVRTVLADVDRVDAAGSGLYREPFVLRPALQAAGGRLLAARADDERWKQILHDSDEPTRQLAERHREGWSEASHLVAPDDTGAGQDVAVPLPDVTGHPVALAAGLEPDATPERIETVVTHLTRAAVAAARILGHG